MKRNVWLAWLVVNEALAFLKLYQLKACTKEQTSSMLDQKPQTCAEDSAKTRMIHSIKSSRQVNENMCCHSSVIHIAHDDVILNSKKCGFCFMKCMLIEMGRLVS